MNRIIKRLVDLGFKRIKNQSPVNAFKKRLRNPFIRNCRMTVDESGILVWGKEPKVLEMGDGLICIAHKEVSEKNLYKLLIFFDCDGKKDKKVRKRKLRIKKRL